MFVVTFSVTLKGAPLGVRDRIGVQPRLSLHAFCRSWCLCRDRFGKRRVVRLCNPRRSYAVSLLASLFAEGRAPIKAARFRVSDGIRALCSSAPYGGRRPAYDRPASTLRPIGRHRDRDERGLSAERSNNANLIPKRTHPPTER